MLLELPSNMKASGLFLLPFLFAVALTSAFSQSSDPTTPRSQSIGSAPDLTSAQKAKIEQLAKLQKNFGKNMNSPGVELSLREDSRSKTMDRTLVDYDLYAKGFPRNTTYSLFEVRMDGSTVKSLEGITLDAEGQAICAGREGTCQGNGPNDPIGVTVYAAKGEAKRFVLVSDDEQHLKAFAFVVPFPNAKSDRNCRLESILGTPNGELMFVEGTGFEPSAELVIDGQSYGEKEHYTSTADGSGSYFAALMPYVAGKKSGETTFEVKAKNCNPKLTFSWGENSYRLR
jgi:hypothetical protein